MKYKLLAEKGMHFVCLDDGTKIPCQTKTTVTQYQRLAAVVDVVALCQSVEVPGGWLLFKEGGIYMGNIRLLNLDKVWFKPDYTMHEKGHLGHCHFTVEAELVDTIEQPKSPNL